MLSMSWAAPPSGKRTAAVKKSVEITTAAAPWKRRIPEHKHQGGMFKVQGRAKRMFKVQSSGFKVHSSRFKVQSSGFKVQSSGFRKEGVLTLNIEH
jgi:hypothetical protein